MSTTVESILNILGFFGGAFMLSLIINRFLLKFAHSLGIRHQTDVQVRWSNESKPALGGVSFYICFLIGFMFYAIIFGQSDVFGNPQLLGLFSGVTLAFLLGLSDDAYDTRPKIKLSAQILCGVILIFTNSGIQLFEYDWLNWTLTVLWVVGIMNSINMLDNMDGITTVTSISIILTILGISIPFSMVDNVNLFMLITTLGALAGFLIFNWNPAKMFMGDTGSMFLGIFLAFFSIRYLWNNGLDSGDYSIFSNMTLVLITFCVPIIDTTYVVIKRIRRGQSPMIGGKDHTTHTLSYKGMSDQQVAIIFALLGIISCLLALNVAKYIPVDSLLLVLIWIYVLTLFVSIFVLGNGSKESSKEEE